MHGLTILRLAPKLVPEPHLKLFRCRSHSSLNVSARHTSLSVGKAFFTRTTRHRFPYHALLLPNPYLPATPRVPEPPYEDDTRATIPLHPPPCFFGKPTPPFIPIPELAPENGNGSIQFPIQHSANLLDDLLSSTSSSTSA